MRKLSKIAISLYRDLLSFPVVSGIEVEGNFFSGEQTVKIGSRMLDSSYKNNKG